MIGKVVKIPNSFQIVVSKENTSEKISIGDKVAIYEVASDVLDPSTGEKMGTFDFIKEELTVDEVENNFFVCSDKETREVNPFAVDLTALLPRKETYRATLNVDEDQNENLVIKDPVIRIGDPVKKILT